MRAWYLLLILLLFCDNSVTNDDVLKLSEMSATEIYRNFFFNVYVNDSTAYFHMNKRHDSTTTAKQELFFLHSSGLVDTIKFEKFAIDSISADECYFYAVYRHEIQRELLNTGYFSAKVFQLPESAYYQMTMVTDSLVIESAINDLSDAGFETELDFDSVTLSICNNNPDIKYSKFINTGDTLLYLSKECTDWGGEGMIGDYYYVLYKILDGIPTKVFSPISDVYYLRPVDINGDKNYEIIIQQGAGVTAQTYMYNLNDDSNIKDSLLLETQEEGYAYAFFPDRYDSLLLEQ